MIPTRKLRESSTLQTFKIKIQEKFLVRLEDPIPSPGQEVAENQAEIVV